jgi:hypothetical protein
VRGDAPWYFDSARIKIMERISDRLFDLNEKYDIQIDPEIEKIRSHIQNRSKSLRKNLICMKAR